MKNKIDELGTTLASASDMQQKIDIMNALAWDLRDLDKKRGSELAETAYTLAKTEQYKKGLAESLIARSQYIYNNYRLALDQGMEALALFEELGDRAGQSRALLTLCWAHWSFDNFVEAVELGRRAQKLAHEIGDQALEAFVLNNLGLTYKRSGSYGLGFTVYQEALSLYRSLGDKLGESKVLTNIALALVVQGQYDRALVYAEEGFQLQIDQPLVKGYTFLVLGQTHAGLKNLDNAMIHLNQAVLIARENANEQLLLAATNSIGEVYMEQKELHLAIEHLKQALTLAEECKSNLYVYRCHESISRIYESLGELDLALTHYKAFHTVKETVFNEKNTNRLQMLELHHQTEITRREAEIYKLRNVELEQEITERKRVIEALRLSEEKLHKQATTDELTGIINRRHFLSLASYELKRVLRLNKPLALALIDIDDFKQVNDLYGHAVGDQVLIKSIQTIQRNIREIDIFARFGGDEFVLLLPETNLDLAYRVVERTRQLLVSQPTRLDDLSIEITISAGISELRDAHDTLDTLLERADRALYRAKESGRNRVSFENVTPDQTA